MRLLPANGAAIAKGWPAQVLRLKLKLKLDHDDQLERLQKQKQKQTRTQMQMQMNISSYLSLAKRHHQQSRPIFPPFYNLEDVVLICAHDPMAVAGDPTVVVAPTD